MTEPHRAAEQRAALKKIREQRYLRRYWRKYAKLNGFAFTKKLWSIFT